MNLKNKLNWYNNNFTNATVIFFFCLLVMLIPIAVFDISLLFIFGNVKSSFTTRIIRMIFNILYYIIGMYQFPKEYEKHIKKLKNENLKELF